MQNGVVHGDYLDSIFESMTQVFSPMLYTNKMDWPVSVRNEFATGMNKFMTQLTETHNQRKFMTVLYVPTEDLQSQPFEALARDRELVQRIETTLIHWTRKIKEVLHSLTSQNVTTPLEEIEFWSKRCQDMSGIGSQLHKDGVVQIVEFLKEANSPYVKTFESWAVQITDGLAQATSNLKFLTVLKDPCEKLDACEPAALDGVLPGVIDLIRLIQLHSQYYNGREAITGLYHKVSHTVIMNCSNHIDLDDVFTNDITAGEARLHTCIDACNLWKETYEVRRQAHVRGCPERSWNVNHDSVFAQVDAFIQRCRDLIDVCMCVRHFGNKTGTTEHSFPQLTGTNAHANTRSMEGIRNRFRSFLALLRKEASAERWNTHTKRGTRVCAMLIDSVGLSARTPRGGAACVGDKQTKSNWPPLTVLLGGNR